MDSEENIEKIIEKTVVSDMKFVKGKAAPAKKNKKDKVPEVILPKTIAQLNEEMTLSNQDVNDSNEIGADVKAESMVKEDKPLKSKAKKEEGFRTVKTYDSKLDRIQNLKKLVDSPKMIGGTEELIPFSWRNPLKIQKGKKVSKVLKVLSKEERARELFLPVKTDN